MCVPQCVGGGGDEVSQLSHAGYGVLQPVWVDV